MILRTVTIVKWRLICYIIVGDDTMYSDITKQANEAIKELIEKSNVRAGDLVVIGCSSSEILGARIGKGSSPDAAKAAVEGILPVIREHGLYLAAQCCEHLNRALVIEREAAEKFGYDEVCVRPQPKAGGSFATAVYESYSDPVMVEHVQAKAGLDIGGTLIGMHMKHVAVPLRLNARRIGEASLTAAYYRPKLIGGERACYPEKK